MYRLRSPFEGRNASWQYVKDGTVVLMYFTIMARAGLGKTNVKLYGLDSDANYTEESTGKTYSGSYLMNVGLYFIDNKDFESKLLIFKKVN